MWLNAQINGVRKTYLVDVLCKAMLNTRRWESSSMVFVVRPYCHELLSNPSRSYTLLSFVFSRAPTDIFHLYF